MSGSSHDSDSTTAKWQAVEQKLYNPESDTELTSVIIELVAAAEETEVTSFEGQLLYDVVNIEAVEDALFGRDGTSCGVVNGSVRFEYRGYRITISSDGWIQVATPDGL